MIGFLSADLMSPPMYGVLFLYYGASSGVKPTSTQQRTEAKTFQAEYLLPATERFAG